MTDQFSDYETSKMLRELGFNESCLKVWSVGGRSTLRPQDYSLFDYTHFHKDINECKNSSFAKQLYTSALYLQIKQWLWQNHGTSIDTMYSFVEKCFRCHISYPKQVKNDVLQTKFDSPIIAETEGIKQAVEFLHKQLKTKTQ